MRLIVVAFVAGIVAVSSYNSQQLLPSAFWYARGDASSACPANAPAGRPRWPLYLFPIDRPDGTRALLSIGQYFCATSNEYSQHEPAVRCDVPPYPSIAQSLDGGSTWTCLLDTVPTSLLRVGAATVSAQFGYGILNQTYWLICVAGGTVIQTSNPPERTVMCSSDGLHWKHRQALPTPTTRATMVPVNPSAVMLVGGIRDDDSQDMWLGILGTEIPGIQMWQSLPSSPGMSLGTRAHPLVQTQLPDSAYYGDTSTVKVVVGGGVRPPDPNTGAPATVLVDLFVCVRCEYFNAFVQSAYTLPVPRSWDAGSISLLSWGGQGLVGTPFEYSCYNASDPVFKCMVLLLGDRMFLSSSPGVDVVWESLDQVVMPSGLPRTPLQGGPSGLILRSADIVLDDSGQSSIVGYKDASGVVAAVLPLPCLASCGADSVHNGCRAGPLDAECIPCDSCTLGVTYANQTCSLSIGVTGAYGSQSTCSPCSSCGDRAVLAQCNATTDTICAPAWRPEQNGGAADTPQAWATASWAATFCLALGLSAVSAYASARAGVQPDSTPGGKHQAGAHDAGRNSAGLVDVVRPIVPLCSSAVSVSIAFQFASALVAVQRGSAWQAAAFEQDRVLLQVTAALLWMSICASAVLAGIIALLAANRGLRPRMRLQDASSRPMVVRVGTVATNIIAGLHGRAAYHMYYGGAHSDSDAQAVAYYPSSGGLAYKRAETAAHAAAATRRLRHVALHGSAQLEAVIAVCGVVVLAWRPTLEAISSLPASALDGGAARAQDAASLRFIGAASLACAVAVLLLITGWIVANSASHKHGVPRWPVMLSGSPASGSTGGLAGRPDHASGHHASCPDATVINAVHSAVVAAKADGHGQSMRSAQEAAVSTAAVLAASQGSTLTAAGHGTDASGISASGISASGISASGIRLFVASGQTAGPDSHQMGLQSYQQPVHMAPSEIMAGQHSLGFVPPYQLANHPGIRAPASDHRAYMVAAMLHGALRQASQYESGTATMMPVAPQQQGPELASAAAGAGDWRGGMVPRQSVEAGASDHEPGSSVDVDTDSSDSPAQAAAAPPPHPRSSALRTAVEALVFRLEAAEGPEDDEDDEDSEEQDVRHGAQGQGHARSQRAGPQTHIRPFFPQHRAGAVQAYGQHPAVVSNVAVGRALSSVGEPS